MSKKVLDTKDNGKQIAYQLSNIHCDLENINKTISNGNEMIAHSNEIAYRKDNINDDLYVIITELEEELTVSKIAIIILLALSAMLSIIMIL